LIKSVRQLEYTIPNLYTTRGDLYYLRIGHDSSLPAQKDNEKEKSSEDS